MTWVRWVLFVALMLALVAASAPHTCAAQSADAVRHSRTDRNPTAAISLVLMVPPVYEDWWRDAQACARADRGQLAEWSVYTISEDGFAVEGSDDVFSGFTFITHKKILVVLDKWLDRKQVTHEFLHAVLYENRRPYGHHQKDDDHYSPADSVFIRCDLGVPPLKEKA